MRKLRTHQPLDAKALADDIQSLLLHYWELTFYDDGRKVMYKPKARQ